MGNPPARGFYIFQMKDILKNWRSPSIMWIRVINIARAFWGLITYGSPQIKENDESKPILPPEVIIEILSWLPIKSLAQVQLVCREWRAVVRDHYFIKKHAGHSAVLWHWYNVSLSRDYHFQCSFHYICGCDGLVLLRNNSSLKNILWNPATQLLLELPDPHHDTYGFGFSFVPATGNYKIVSIYKDKESGGEGYEVYTPGHSKAWRHLTFPGTLNLKWHRKKESVSVVSAGGAVHCILDIKVGPENFQEIVSLDMETECFTVNQLPKGLFNDRAVCALHWDDKLVLANIVGEDLHVMELEDYKKHRWCEEKKIISLPFMKKDKAGKGCVIPLFSEQGTIWFWLKYEKIFTYTIETGRLMDVTQEETFSLRNKLYPYRPSLITFEGMVPDTKLQRCRAGIKFD